MTTSGTIRITARTLDLAREALADWRAENPNRVLDKPVLAEGGATASQIAAWTGHKTLAEVEHYTREYDRMKAVMG